MMLTHKGWFGLCPVYIGDIHGDAPLLVERHWSLLPLMVISEWLFAAIMFVQKSPVWLKRFDPPHPHHLPPSRPHLLPRRAHTHRSPPVHAYGVHGCDD